MLDHSCQTQRHKISSRGNDLYETPPIAVEALLRFENLPISIWEPACGPGSIVGILRSRGHHVLATDLVDYDCPDSYHGRDFLLEGKAGGIDCIVTNPPFKLAEEFLARSLEFCPRVVFLLRLAFLESERRSCLLDTGHLHRVYVFRKRLPMMHRHGWEGRKANSGMAFAWFVFDQTSKRDTIIKRISWEREG